MNLCRICPIDLERDVFSRSNNKCLACKHYRRCYDIDDRRDETNNYLSRLKKTLKLMIKENEDNLQLKGQLIDCLSDVEKVIKLKRSIEGAYNGFTFKD